MLTIKRLYLYGVLGVSLVLLLWGLTDLLRFAFDEIARSMGSSPAFGADLAREDLSRAVALMLVAGSIYAVHLALVRRTLRGAPAEVADERASASRSTYFFLVLIGTGAALFWALHDLGFQLIVTAAFDDPGWYPEGPLASALVVGAAWLLHLRARGVDLRAAPERTAGDWLTRGYLYGALFVTAMVFALESAETLTTSARGLLDVPPAWAPYGWWEEAIAGPVAATLVAAAGWLAHWFMASRLLHAPDPMGSAHRSAHTRRGYFVVVVLAAAVASLVLGSLALRDLLEGVLGTAQPRDGWLVEDVGGPLLMVVPFVLVGWGHARVVQREAKLIGGALLARATVRTLRLVVAAVGLAGLAAGLAWQLHALIDAVGSSGRETMFSSGSFTEASSEALAMAVVGLVLWVPAWALSQRERARHAPEAATSAARRAYLMLVSGLSVIAAMGSLAYLVWQATRVLLDSGRLEDPSWAVAILIVALVVLGYHLWQLRLDLRLASTAEAPAPASPGAEAQAHETIEILAPAGADFSVLNAAIRSELPAGYELRVVS